ncbi:MAG: hypothetical protein C0483_19855 [Pirellula sp.]|nr:hypothetical protein [Pirellula sp.]
MVFLTGDHEMAATTDLSPSFEQWLSPPKVAAGTPRNLARPTLLESELRSQIQQLESAARHKDECLGMLAHELRNPLAAICGAVQLVQQIGPPDGELPEMFDVIARQAEHMARLIENMLDAARVAHDKVHLRQEVVDVAQIIGQAMETCRPLFDARRQIVTVTLPERSIQLVGDPTRLIQIVTNLLNNAAKYTDEGGQIRLTAIEGDEELVIRVRDNGIGIRSDLLPRVFELFSQAEEARERSQGGLGIGLAVVGHLVQLHGGTIHATSAGLGLGSEFVVRLPLPAAGR